MKVKASVARKREQRLKHGFAAALLGEPLPTGPAREFVVYPDGSVLCVRWVEDGTPWHADLKSIDEYRRFMSRMAARAKVKVRSLRITHQIHSPQDAKNVEEGWIEALPTGTKDEIALLEAAKGAFA